MRSKSLILAFVILLITLTPVMAADEHPGSYQELTLSQNVEGQIIIEKESSSSTVSDVKATLHLKPLESYRQRIIDSDTIPVSMELDESVIYIWENPTSSDLRFSHSARVETTAYPKPIRTKAVFPLEDIPLSVQPYLDETDNIDSSDEIRQVATELAQGEDDLFIIEAKLASWVHDHVEYNLTTLTSEVNQPASWVMESRYGVCDEITNLFISMNRALGIPARFVSGVAYSEAIPDEDNWGNHGWAEVYYPETGWVPYDVTYNQLGFIDATHIELQKGVDGNKPSVSYQYKGRDIDISTRPLDFSTRMTSHQGSGEERTQASIEMLEEEVGFGSYNLARVTMENPNEYYVVEEVKLHPTRNMVIDTTPTTELAALAPGEKKIFSWVVHTPKSLDTNYIYTFPVVMSRTFRTSINTSFSVSRQGEVYSKEYMQQRMEEEDITSQGENGLELECSIEEKEVLATSEQTITCSAETTEDMYPVMICHKGNCKNVKDEQEKVELTFDTGLPKVTTTTITASSKDNEIITSTYVTYTVVDIPKLEITNANITPMVKADGNASLSFEIVKKSVATPESVSVTVSHPLFSNMWQINEFSKNKQFKLNIPGSRLTPDENVFTIIIKYDTGEESIETIRHELSTRLETETFSQKVSAKSNQLDVAVTKAFKKIAPQQAEKVPLPVQRMIAYIIMLGVLLLIVSIITTIKRAQNVSNDDDEKDN
ncbi:MAG: transglutaminase-like domain-containing protein [Nanobdellota archaeon]